MIKKLFTFWKQKEKPKVQWWCTVEGVEKSTPILPAKEFIPEWWKKVEKLGKSDGNTFSYRAYGVGTVKNCPSFPEYLTQGFVVPLWCDVHLNVNKNQIQWHTPNEAFQFEIHSDAQFRDYVPQHIKDTTSLVLKPACPWHLKTPPGWSVWQLPMTYHYSPVFETLPGVIWTDIHHEVNQQMLIKKYGEFTIPRGTPLAMYVPYERKNYTYEVNGPNNQNWKWVNQSNIHVQTKFKGGYKLHQDKIKKCPIKH